MMLEHFTWDKPGSGISVYPAPMLDQQTGSVLWALVSDLYTTFESIEFHDSASTCGLIQARIQLNNINRAQLDGLLSELHRTFEREASAHMFFHLQKGKTTFYEPRSLLSDLARTKFPTSEKELGKAATGYAVGLETASVFHSMRALEKPIVALARKLRVKLAKDIELETWGNIHRGIAKQVDALRNSPHTKRRDEQLEFYSKAGMEFGYLKDAWRNYVSHDRASYDSMQALSALQHSIGFIDGLSLRV
jgi:hypothetical protein